MCPIVMRSLGGVACYRATTWRGTIIGAMAAAAAVRRKSRRFTCERGVRGFFDILPSIRARASGLTPGGAGQYKDCAQRYYVCAIRKQGFRKKFAPTD